MQTPPVLSSQPLTSTIIENATTPASTNLTSGNGVLTINLSDSQSSIAPITLLTLPDDVLALIMRNIEDTNSILSLSTTCKRFRVIFQDDRVYQPQEREFHLFAHNLVTTPAFCAKLYDKWSNQIVIPMPDTFEWQKLKDQPLAADLNGEARQIALIQKAYITTWYSLLQPEVRNNRIQAAEQMQLLLALLPCISNPKMYAAMLFKNYSAWDYKVNLSTPGFSWEVFNQLAAIHLDRCLRVVARHFPTDKGRPASKFIIYQLPGTSERWADVASRLEKNEIESFLLYAAEYFYSFDGTSTDRDKAVRELFQKLFDCGCDLEQINKNGDTALIFALRFTLQQSNEQDPRWKARLYELVNLLIAQGANCNATDKDGNTPLIIVCQTGQAELLSLLLQQPQIDVNAKNNQGRSALEYAIEFSTLSIVQTLLTHQALNSDTRISALTYAMRRNKNEMVQALSQVLTPEEKDSLQELVYKLTQLAVEQSINYDVPNEKGETALMIACQSSQTELIPPMLQHPQVNVNARDNKGYSALEYAIQAGNLPILQILLTHSTLNLDTRLAAFTYAILIRKDEMSSAFLQALDAQEKRAFIMQALTFVIEKRQLGLAKLLREKYNLEG